MTNVSDILKIKPDSIKIVIILHNCMKMITRHRGQKHVPVYEDDSDDRSPSPVVNRRGTPKEYKFAPIEEERHHICTLHDDLKWMLTTDEYSIFQTVIDNWPGVSIDIALDCFHASESVKLKEEIRQVVDLSHKTQIAFLVQRIKACRMLRNVFAPRDTISACESDERLRSTIGNASVMLVRNDSVDGLGIGDISPSVVQMLERFGSFAFMTSPFPPQQKVQVPLRLVAMPEKVGTFTYCMKHPDMLDKNVYAIMYDSDDPVLCGVLKIGKELCDAQGTVVKYGLYVSLRSLSIFDSAVHSFVQSSQDNHKSVMQIAVEMMLCKAGFTPASVCGIVPTFGVFGCEEETITERILQDLRCALVASATNLREYATTYSGLLKRSDCCICRENVKDIAEHITVHI